MNNILVSVIIPCYNHGIYLSDCLDSIKHQTFRNIEIIIVNDGSNDSETIQILSLLKDKNISVINKENAGLAAARNTGIEVASGEIILPLDADDKIGPKYIEQAVELLESNSEIGAVFCQGEYFGKQSGSMNKAYISFKSHLLYNSFFCSGIFRKEDYIKVGGYNTNMKVGYEDWDFWIRLFKYKSIIKQLPETMFYYRKVGNSMWDGLSNNIGARTEMENTLFKNNIDIYMDEWGSMIEVLREYEILKNNNDTVEKAIQQVKNSYSYKIGNIVLFPFKYLLKKKHD